VRGRTRCRTESWNSFRWLWRIDGSDPVPKDEAA
jgi:hypothetical protein